MVDQTGMIFTLDLITDNRLTALALPALTARATAAKAALAHHAL